MAGDILEYFRQDGRKLLRMQCMAEIEDLDDKQFGMPFRMPSNDFWCIRLGIIVGKHTGCNFTFSNPKNPRDRYGDKGRFFGVPHDLAVARKAYRKYGKLILQQARVHGDPDLKPGLTEKLAAVLYDVRLKAHLDPELKEHISTFTRRYERANIGMFLAMQERKKGRK